MRSRPCSGCSLSYAPPASSARRSGAVGPKAAAYLPSSADAWPPSSDVAADASRTGWSPEPGAACRCRAAHRRRGGARSARRAELRRARRRRARRTGDGPHGLASPPARAALGIGHLDGRLPGIWETAARVARAHGRGSSRSPRRLASSAPPATAVTATPMPSRSTPRVESSKDAIRGLRSRARWPMRTAQRAGPVRSQGFDAAIHDLLIALRTTWDEWARTRWAISSSARHATALLVFVVLLAVSLLVLRGQLHAPGIAARQDRRCPRCCRSCAGRRSVCVRHLPLVLFLAGVPFFAIALADPQTGFTREEVSYPGPAHRAARRCLDQHGHAVQVDDEAQGESTFFTAVAAAEQFIRAPDERALPGSGRADPVRQLRLRRHAVHQRLREHPAQHPAGRRSRASGDAFRDWGTTIIEGIDQATQLFKTFDFVNASGNLMIVFTDGRDSELSQQKAARHASSPRRDAGRFRST